MKERQIAFRASQVGDTHRIRRPRPILRIATLRPRANAPQVGCGATLGALRPSVRRVPQFSATSRIGLDGEDLRSALLGLGSTYRALGDYEKAHSVLERGVELFPADRGILAFFAMALYNIGRAKPACEILLGVLTETTSDPSISQYEKAISLYAEDLDRTW
ncbi:MAG: tetratricopeptide repeat protein [Acidobacteria bacterium]|nr:tetratricopeptide repeat protein [Acidobacteriota bacterium]